MEYTPGEWKVSSKGISIVGEDEFPIALCYPDTRLKSPESLTQMQANARLIAAAPDLYEKLLKVKQWVAMLLNHTEHQILTCNFITLKKALEADIKNYKVTLADIEQALAKAEGK